MVIIVIIITLNTKVTDATVVIYYNRMIKY